MELNIGISLPTMGQDIPDITEVARIVEDAGFDSVWVGDHLADGRPILDCTVALAAAAAVTTRVNLGFGVLQLALRPPVWAAKQIASLQYLSGNRIVLGIGTGGSVPREWDAAGVPMAGRGARTDRMLADLPALLAGKSEVALLPPVPMPPVWIGGSGERALSRACEFGDGWLSAPTDPGRLTAEAGRLRALAGHKSRPQVGCVVLVAAGDSADALIGMLTARLGMTGEQAAGSAVAGTPAEIADRLAGYVSAGARQLVLAPFGPRWRTQVELLTEARHLLEASWTGC